MPTGLQANNLGPMGFGQPNMRQAAAQQPGPGYGMPARPVAPGQQAQPSRPPSMPRPPQGPPVPMGVPALYQSPEAKRAPARPFPAEAVYNRVQQAILNPGPPTPQMAPPQAPMGMPPMAAQMSPGFGPPMMGGPVGPPDMAEMMQFMQQYGGGSF
jgi:hypothetical protein